jgi:hypothetical protein
VELTLSNYFINTLLDRGRAIAMLLPATTQRVFGFAGVQEYTACRLKVDIAKAIK